ncbi:MAG: LacI family transcriptional regulator, partial [Gemmiger sp.]|nr:LacI family transcriptional regulator [Gemmiger sp.]
MKKFAALAVAGCMAVSLAACGGSASTTPASSEAASTESAATSAAESAAESVTEATQGGKVGVCIYKFDDAFMTTYRNALQEILEG